MPRILVVASMLLLGGLPAPATSATEPAEGVLRVATYNVSMYRDRAGQLLEELEAGDSLQAKQVAEVLQRVRPHVVLLNEFDYMPGPAKLPRVFREKYLEKSQAGLKPIAYPTIVYEPVNTGVDSGKDLDRDGALGGPADAWGFGHYPGQYGMLVLSQLPVGERRLYQKLAWRVLPAPNWPKYPANDSHYYSDAERRSLRLASKSFWDIAIRLPGNPPTGGRATGGRATEGRSSLYLLCSHPTPPVFDGPEDRNGCRNFDEIRLVAEYITNRGRKLYPDDSYEGHTGLPASGPFVVLGDLNADPTDGGGRPGAIQQLLDHPQIDSSFVPTSDGAVACHAAHADINSGKKGNPAHDTANFNRDGYPNLRVDYVLPSKGLKVVGGGVFWPKAGEPGAQAIAASDHRLVWIDIELLEKPVSGGDATVP